MIGKTAHGVLRGNSGLRNTDSIIAGRGCLGREVNGMGWDDLAKGF